MRALGSLAGFPMYTHYGRAGAIPTQRVYRLSDIACPENKVALNWFIMAQDVQKQKYK